MTASTRISSLAWDALSDVERAALVLLAADFAEEGQIDPDKLVVLYDGLPIQSLATNQDPRIADPCLAALVAIDQAARAVLEPFELRERVLQMDDEECSALLERAREQLRERARYDAREIAEAEREEAPPITSRGSLLTDEDDDSEDCDYLPFAEATIPARAIHTVIAQPCDGLFLARRLAVALPPEIARHLTLWMSCGRDQHVLEGVSAEAFIVRVPSDPSRPIDRGARVRDTKVYPPLPMVLKIENRSLASVVFSAILRGRSPA